MNKKSNLAKEVEKMQKRLASVMEPSDKRAHYIRLAKHLDKVLGVQKDEPLSPSELYTQGQKMLFSMQG